MSDSKVVGVALCQVRGRVLVEGASEGAAKRLVLLAQLAF